MLCNPTTLRFQNLFTTSRGNPTHIKQSLLLPAPPPLVTTNPLSVSVDLSIPDISYQWKPTICDLLCLAFSLNVMFKIHPCGSVHLHLTPFYS